LRSGKFEKLLTNSSCQDWTGC